MLSSVEVWRDRQLCRLLVAMADFTRVVGAAPVDGHDPVATSDHSVAVLAELLGSGTIRPRDVRGVTGLTTGGLSNLFTRLERSGLIVRITDPASDDGRAVQVRLTPHGRSVAKTTCASILRNAQRNDLALRQLLLLAEHLGASVHSFDVGSKPTAVAFVRELSAVTRQLDVTLAGSGVDASGSLVLLAIADSGPCRPRFLADRLGMTTAGTSNTLERLERRGLLHRSPRGDAGDLRAVLVELTSEGADTVTRVIRLLDERFTDVAGLLVSMAAAAEGPHR